MMRGVFVAVLACVCLGAALASPTSGKDYVSQRKIKISDKQQLQRQLDILRLFRYINEPSYFKDFVEIASTWSIESNIDSYTNPQAVKEFGYYHRKGLLPRGEIFSEFYEPQLKQAVALFKVLYYAKDFDTFFKTAVWARNNVNEGMFLYAVSVAIAHREDTYNVILPPIYEIYPYYFYNGEVIEKAIQYKQQYYGKEQKENVYTIVANYSGHYLNLHPEQSMSYFMEDVGINAFYYYYNLYYPFWMSGEEFKLKNDRRGEQYYYLYQQLLARYYLERLSNDFGEIEMFNYDLFVPTGYYPSLRYSNGLEFPERPNFAQLHEYFYNYGQKYAFKGKYPYSYTLVKDYERRIRDTIDSGFAFTKAGKLVDLYSEQGGIEVLANIIESNPDSPNTRFYGPLQIYGRHLLGYSTQPQSTHKLAPSALEHFETSLRDPAFYQFYKRIVLLFQKYKTQLTPYTYNELAYPGVKIESVQIDRLITYKEVFESDISNAVWVTPQEYESGTPTVRVRQYRLNHKPYTFKINANAEQAGEAVVRVYLGPKYDEYNRVIEINENRINFVELTAFKYTLKQGKNVIECDSTHTWYGNDRTSVRALYDKVEAAVKNGEELQLDATELSYLSFPARYQLPKGKRGGQVFQLYVIINKFEASTLKQDQKEENIYHPRVGTGGNYIDALPFGFPLDRPVDEYNFYKVPNAYFQDVTIYYKDADEINSSVDRETA